LKKALWFLLLFLLIFCFTLTAGATEEEKTLYNIQFSRDLQSVDMESKTLSLTLQVENTAGKKLPCTFYTKIVNDDGTVDSCIPHQKTVKAGTSQITLTHVFQEAGENKQLFIYCWNNNMQPLSSVFEETIALKQTVTTLTPDTDSVTLTLANQQTKTLTYSYSPKNLDDPGVFFESSNTNVVTVNAKGLLTPKGVGTATITMVTKDRSATAKCSVKVITDVTKVTLNKTKVTLDSTNGLTYRLTATVTPMDAPNKTLVYKSSNPKVATVSQKGLITAVAEGQTTITVKTADGKASATCKVTVGSMVTSIKLNKTSIKMWDYGMFTLKATIVGDKNAKIKWTSSNDTIATVSDSGIVYGVFKGSATITASIGKIKATCKVQVYREYDYTGSIAAHFESGDNPATISGSGQGKSYGCFQLYAGSNGPQNFYQWLIDNQFNVSIGNTLKTAHKKDGGKKYTFGDNFDTAWKKLAKEQREEFRSCQMAYCMSLYYEPLVNRLICELNFYPDNYGLAMKSALWSRSVQHGPDGAFNRIQAAFKSLGGFKGKTEKQLITAIYKECGKVVSSPPYSNSVPMNSDSSIAREYGLVGKYLRYYSTSSSSIQAGVWKRLNITELEMLYDLQKNPPIAITKE
jgi:uncharacterized protein YjdB